MSSFNSVDCCPSEIMPLNLPIGDPAIEWDPRLATMNVHGFKSNPVEILKVAGGHQGLSKSPSGGPIG
jgi:hypothetical protein